MKVRGLILVLLLPCVAYAGQQYYGTRVAGLSIAGSGLLQADLNVIPLHAGDIISERGVRASIQALYDTGRYSYVEVEAAAAADGGTHLTFNLRPYYFFGAFRLVPGNLLDRSLSGYFRLPFGEKFRNAVVERVKQDTASLLKSEGYFEASVTAESSFDDNTRLASVTLRAVPGVKARVARVRVQGGDQTFSEAELLGALDLKSGDAFSASKLDRSLASLRAKFTALGFLNSRATVDQRYTPATRSVDLNFTVQPGQFALVEVEGYDISKKKLAELVPIYEEGTVDQDLVEEGRAGIAQFMQQEGYFEAVVTSEMIEAPLDNAIQVNYSIVPGPSHRIEAVRIEGNTFFSTDELSRRIKVRASRLLSHGVFSPAILDADVQTIETMYRNTGFEDVNVRGSYQEREHVVDVLIQIREGARLPVAAIAFSGNRAMPDADLRRALRLKEGDTYTPVVLEQARATLTQLYYSSGYPDVRVEPNVEHLEAGAGIRIRFEIVEGNAYSIGRILVAGNTRTAEKIVHRNSNLYPNTPYNPENLLESQQRLYATGLFNRVEIATLDENVPGVRDLLIQVEDASPILLTYGVGYQDFEGPRGTIELSHNNLFGLDRSITFQVRGSRRDQRFQSTYREPRLFNHNLDGFASLFVENTRRKAYDANRIDFSIQTLKRLVRQRSFLLTASYQTVNLQDILVNPQADRFPDERGIIQIARLGATFIRDRRNDALNPSLGSFNTTTFQIASKALGSEVNFTSLFNQSAFYTPVPGGVLASSVRVGWNQPFGGTRVVPITERFFAGGSTTLRGVGLDNALREGGNIMALGNVEYRFPVNVLPISGIGGALFYDTGNVFPRAGDVHLSDFRHAAGFGLRYQTPLGPVRVDIGVNLNPRTGADGSKEDRIKVFFTLGNPF